MHGRNGARDAFRADVSKGIGINKKSRVNNRAAGRINCNLTFTSPRARSLSLFLFLLPSRYDRSALLRFSLSFFVRRQRSGSFRCQASGILNARINNTRARRRQEDSRNKSARAKMPFDPRNPKIRLRGARQDLDATTLFRVAVRK